MFVGEAECVSGFGTPAAGFVVAGDWQALPAVRQQLAWQFEG